MSIESVVQFLEATSEKESLRKDLAGIIGVGDGDISNAQELDQGEAQALLGRRGVLVATFAEQEGYSFTLAELNAVIGTFERVKAGELSETEFASALGLNASAGQTETVGKAVGLVYRGISHAARKDSGKGTQVLEFMRKTAEDGTFREALQGILNVGDGDISNFAELDAQEVQALKSGRSALVAEFAAKHGYVFTMADLFAVVDAFQRLQAGQLTEEEFSKYLQLNAGTSDFFPVIDDVVKLAFKGFSYSTAKPSTAQDNTLQVVRFMEKTDSDPLLRDQLQALIGGDGNISEPGELDAEEAQALGGELGGQLVDLGAEHGFLFAVADLSAVVGAFQLVNNGELSMDNCSRILELGKSADEVIAGVKKTATRMYRGVSY
jgi:hypothetical protein